MTYSVAIYLVDRAFGGPEEGGWWYTYGIPEEEQVHHTKHFEKFDEAGRYSDILHDLIVKGLNEDRRDIGSVLSEGIYEVVIMEGEPKPFPERKPHYE